jgi:UDP-4-amino-4,6-dideoxy-N-acetyl-beta-L-altrosamine N-acetyltransferase
MIRLTKNLNSENMFHWRNKAEIYNWTRQNGLISRAHHDAWFERIKTDPTIQMFTIESGDSDIGVCGLTSISMEHGSAEFSLYIDPSLHKHGYGRAALIELLKYGFNHLRLNSIWGECFRGNHAMKMFTSLGMKTEGHVRERYFKNGEYLDAYIVSILVREAKDQSWFTS